MPINAYVRVDGEEVNDALKAFKRKVEREGLIREMKKYTFYEKPTEARRRKKLKAKRKQLKLLNKMRRLQG
ncbi:30S ribosomal protein S21 [Desulfurispirillum indicum]|uniref:Small ribosomal subunit protein bS21 n=1 Tax=Desulfurispirillum indicum (strain ATCC BAA-1389 / DSM 22839 / S5) TaxID=653733 RepID=E6W2R7_DESIS|nr:30S ribosomal protein S21 [Desulfurispirillum indicum]ADU65651.1 ribosomal protein S21 [Desulfurispirillum indicum S5]UCZ57515.1 30S ribosomal protein S21 [Desulfurispirillum indicum]